jgi:hypothetical protein
MSQKNALKCFKTISTRAKSNDFISYTLKKYPSCGETVRLETGYIQHTHARIVYF